MLGRWDSPHHQPSQVASHAVPGSNRSCCRSQGVRMKCGVFSMSLWNPAKKKIPSQTACSQRRQPCHSAGCRSCLDNSTGLCPSDSHAEGDIHGNDRAGRVCCGELGKKTKPKQNKQGRPQVFTPLSQKDSINAFRG